MQSSRKGEWVGQDSISELNAMNAYIHVLYAYAEFMSVDKVS